MYRYGVPEAGPYNRMNDKGVCKLSIEKSCGAVVFVRNNGELRYLLIRNLAGAYGFPKGHMEPGETELETARREIMEETGLKVAFVPGFRREDRYFLAQKTVSRHIVYFLAESLGGEYTFPPGEISGGGLFSFAEAEEMLQFEGVRRILQDANEFLKTK